MDGMSIAAVQAGRRPDADRQNGRQALGLTKIIDNACLVPLGTANTVLLDGGSQLALTLAIRSASRTWRKDAAGSARSPRSASTRPCSDTIGPSAPAHRTASAANGRQR